MLDIFIYPPPPISYPQVVSVDKYLSPTIRKWISCGEINGDMFGGVIYNDDLYVLDVLSYGWIRGRGESSLGRVDSVIPQTK